MPMPERIPAPFSFYAMIDRTRIAGSSQTTQGGCMKKSVLYLLVCLVGAALPLPGAVSVQVDLVSRYVWRGFDLLPENHFWYQPRRYWLSAVFQGQVNADGVNGGWSDAGNARRFAQCAGPGPGQFLFHFRGKTVNHSEIQICRDDQLMFGILTLTVDQY